MKELITTLLIITASSCKSVDPKEVEATVLLYSESFTGCSGGFTIQTESGENYETYQLPTPFNDPSKLPLKVWIQYDRVVQDGVCTGSNNRISVKTMRKR